MTVATVLKGHWCPTCRKHPRVPLGDVEASVRALGGTLLATPDGYDGAHSRILVRCSAGHEWMTTGKSVRRGKWCRSCIVHATLPFGEIEEFVQSRGGVVLSPASAYVDTRSVVRLRCAAGHEWETAGRLLRGGRWCRHCAGHGVVSFGQLEAKVRARGGTILSQAFAPGEIQRVRVRVLCAAGHEFETAGRSLWRGTWCARCAGKLKHSLEELRALAASKGGTCLSRRYGVVTDSIRFRCAEGHVFERQAWRALRGSWCKSCEVTAPMRRTIAQQGGQLIDKTCRTNRETVRVQCTSGHRWASTGRKLALGEWCPRCRGE